MKDLRHRPFVAGKAFSLWHTSQIVPRNTMGFDLHSSGAFHEKPDLYPPFLARHDNFTHRRDSGLDCP